jgi:hypothetical protein
MMFSQVIEGTDAPVTSLRRRECHSGSKLEQKIQVFENADLAAKSSRLSETV